MQTPDANTSRVPPPPLPPLANRLEGDAHHHSGSEHGSEHTYRVPTHYESRTGRVLAIIAGVLVIALAVGFFFVHERHSRQMKALDDETKDRANAAPVVDVVSVKFSGAQSALTLPGETAAWYQSTIYARVTGYVGNWYHDIGDKVKKGEVLATLETPDLDAQLAAAQAKLTAARAQVAVDRANAAFAKSTYERWEGTKGGAVSVQETEAKRAEYQTGIAKLNASEAQVRLNEAEVNGLAALTAFKEVTAPYDGVVTGRRVDIGDLVSAGSTANTTPLFSLAQSDWIRVFVDVPQNVASEIVVGMRATVTTSQYAGRRFVGTIARTANAIDPVSRTLHVEVDISNADYALVPGMYVEVAFDLVRKPMLEVPASALVFRSSGPEVAVVGSDSRVQFRPVTIGRDDGDVVDLSSGIAVNDNVALNISSQITEGETVSASPIEGSPAAPTTAGSAMKPGAGDPPPDAPLPPPPVRPPYVAPTIVPGLDSFPATTQPVAAPDLPTTQPAAEPAVIPSPATQPTP